MSDRPTDSFTPPEPDDEPAIYAVRRRDGGWALSRRGFLGGAAAGVGAGMLADADVAAAAAVTLKAHAGPVLCLEVVTAHRLLISGGGDRRVKFWTVPDGAHVQTLSGHRGAVQALAVSPDSQLLASGGADGVVQLWTLPEGQLKRSLQGSDHAVTDLLISPDGSTLAVATDRGIVTFWSLETFRPVQALSARGERTLVLAPDAAGPRGASFFVANGSDVERWPWPAAAVVAKGGIDVEAAVQKAVERKYPKAQEVAIRKKADELYRSYKVGDEVMLSLQTPMNPSVRGPLKRITDTYIVVGSHRVPRIDLDREDSARLDPDLMRRKRDQYLRSQLSRWAAQRTNYAAAARAYFSKKAVPKAAAAAPTQRLSGHKAPVSALAVSDATLAAGADNGALALWGLPGGQMGKLSQEHRRSISALTFNGKGSTVVTGCADHKVRRWSVPELRQVAVFEGHEGTVRAVAYLPGETLLASAADDGTIRFWSLTLNRERLSLVDLEANPPAVEGVRYRRRLADGRVVTFTLPCGSTVPNGAVCVCNCVPGTFTGTLCAADAVVVKKATVPVCTCDEVAVCTCVGAASTCGCVHASPCICDGNVPTRSSDRAGHCPSDNGGFCPMDFNENCVLDSAPGRGRTGGGGTVCTCDRVCSCLGVCSCAGAGGHYWHPN